MNAHGGSRPGNVTLATFVSECGKNVKSAGEDRLQDGADLGTVSLGPSAEDSDISVQPSWS